MLHRLVPKSPLNGARLCAKHQPQQRRFPFARRSSRSPSGSRRPAASLRFLAERVADLALSPITMNSKPRTMGEAFRWMIRANQNGARRLRRFNAHSTARHHSFMRIPLLKRRERRSPAIQGAPRLANRLLSLIRCGLSLLLCALQAPQFPIRRSGIIASPGTILLLALVFASFPGCSKKQDEDLKTPATPQQAATQLDQAFESAPSHIKQNAQAASAALKQGDYEKAVLSLQVVRDDPKVTLDQGLAVHNSTVLLESRLLDAMASGDPQAKRAYEALKAMKRK